MRAASEAAIVKVKAKSKSKEEKFKQLITELSESNDQLREEKD